MSEAGNVTQAEVEEAIDRYIAAELGDADISVCWDETRQVFIREADKGGRPTSES